MKSLILRIISGPLTETKVMISSDQSLRVGRAPSADLSVMDPMMSREHFQLSGGHSRWLLRDLESRNGTKLNGREIREVAAGVILEDGDVISAGCTTFEVRFHDWSE